MTPPLKCFYFCKIKTDVIDIYAYFIFMYPRSSSRELHDTPHREEQNTNNKLTLQGCLFILHKGYYICLLGESQEHQISFYTFKFWKNARRNFVNAHGKDSNR